jgi:molybdopterin molybdotransferase
MIAPQRFAERLPFVDACAWVDARADRSCAERIYLRESFGRILAESLLFPVDRPDRDQSLIDGYAVLAESTFGASSYTPLLLTLVPRSAPLVAGLASVCHAGETLPSGADAVLSREAGDAVGAVLEVCDAVARGAGVGRRGRVALRGDVALTAGCRLAAPQIALAASLGVAELSVRRRPHVAVVLAGAKPPATEALGAALAALVTRDSGIPRLIHCEGNIPGALANALPADVVLLVGRSGWGEDDDALRSISAAGGRIVHHGVAMTPGGSSGLGWLGAAPLLLLPGDPISALIGYELLAGRLLRRLAGGVASWPYPMRRLTLARKIVSSIGISEFVPVICNGCEIVPMALPLADGLAALARADGFLVVPAGLEGYAPGTSVNVVLTSDSISGQESG